MVGRSFCIKGNAMLKRLTLISSVAVLALALWLDRQPGYAQAPKAAPVFSAERIRADVKHLADDRFEGRGIGTLGEERAIEFIAAEFAKAGLKPAGQRGTFFQTVPLVDVTTGPKA